MRAQILDHLGGTAGRIVEKWPEVNKWMWGKDSHWNEQRGQLKTLHDFRRKDFAALASNGVPEDSEYLVREQLNAWAMGMEPVWESGNRLADYPQASHDTIRPLAEAVVEAVDVQRGQSAFLDQML
jgi:hypothetical protein